MILIKQGTPEERLVPCGRCHECISAKINAWVFRLKEQHKVSLNNVFLTLTYDDEHLPYVTITDCHFDSNDNAVYTSRDVACFNKQHVQNFIRSIRDKIRYEGKKIGLSRKRIKHLTSNFKYFLVSEYGGKTKRPHYHALLFNLPAFIIDWYEQFCKMWPYGFLHFGNVTDASIIYTAGYLFKTVEFPKDLLKEQKVFLLCSNGIGKDFLTTSMVDYLKDHVSSFIEIDGHKVKLPRYILEKMYPKLVCSLLSEQNLAENQARVEDYIQTYGIKEYIRMTESLNELKRKRFIKKKTKEKI